MVDGCLGFKSVAQHVGDNKIFTILRKEGEYHDEANNLHLRIVHPVAVREIGATKLESNFYTDFGDLLDKHEADLDLSVDKKVESDGWEGTCQVIGIEPERSFREAVIRCLEDNGYVESHDKVVAVDDWHYQVTGEMRLWEKKENLLSPKINEALRQAGWNVTVTVQLVVNGDASFIIDITKHSLGTYYALVQYDSHMEAFERDVLISRNPDELYLTIIRRIFQNEDDADARIEAIQSLLESGHCEACDDDYILEFRPQLLLQSGDILADNNLYGAFAFRETIEYIDLPDFDEEEDPQEAHDEFMENLEAEGKNLYCLNVK
jgi:hypothetical protein